MFLLRGVVCAAFILIAVAACSGANSRADQAVRNDFRRYLTQLSLVTDIEVEGNEANKKAVSEPGANDATYAVALRGTIIPKFEEFERELARVHPTTNEIIGLHKILLKRAGGQVAGFRELEQSTRGGGNAAIEKANALFAEGKACYQRWSQKMDELNKRYPNTQ